MAEKQHAANRLAGETSPYLLQHAQNPVDWHPWGEEAFEKARREDKPIFLSVGYSACHWCHVMERESFENQQIADLLNRHYVSIKVDREERPDIDQIYMSAVQLITQRGGWPMSVFLTPDGKPFYGGTYWPPTSRMGMPGFQDILLKLHDYWVNKRSEVTTSAEELVAAIGRMASPDLTPAPIGPETLQKGMRELIDSADPRHGGFGGAPKFPHPMDIRLLLRCWKRFDNEQARAVARLTLDKMARGGIYDHLGGGFHRYSTDAHWLVPHFEKMLYDNALLVPAYLEMYQITRGPSYARVARETLDYVLREMSSPEGGFYSTQDADSEGEEGKFFVWTEEEITALLGPDESRLFNYCYDVTSQGNWEGRNILNRPKPHNEAAKVLGVDEMELAEVLSRCRQKLFEARSKRVAPGRDDKVLAGWNGMMIAAFAQAALVLGEGRYAEAAARAAAFIRERMRDQDGRLLHSFKDGRARFNAYLDDYACYIDGLTYVYEATFDARYAEWAVEAAEQMLAHYADRENGGSFYTPDDHEQLIARTKDAQDNATPSGNGMAATALLRLGRLCDRTEFLKAADRTLESMSGLVAEHPRISGQALIALDSLLGPKHEIVIVDGTGADAAKTGDAFVNETAERFLPGRLLLRRRLGGPAPTAVATHFEGRDPQSETLCYVCTDGTCRAPMRTSEELRKALP